MKQLLSLAASLLFACISVHAQDPDPNRILEGARLSAALTKLDTGLKGHLSNNGKKIPIEIFLKGK
ncbi:MAG: hypothetical protein ACK5AA_01685 [Akkermansiaceae bacterium]